MSDAPHPPGPNTPRRAGRWLRWALGLSLAMNVLVIGLVVGLAVSFRGGPGGEGPGLRAFGLSPVALALEREDRAALRARLQADRGNFRASGEGFAGAMGALTEALRRDPFDRDAAEAALMAQRDTARELHSQGHRVLLEYLGGMALNDRVALADTLDRRLERNLRRGPAERESD